MITDICAVGRSAYVAMVQLGYASKHPTGPCTNWTNLSLIKQFFHNYEWVNSHRITQPVEQGFIQDPFTACTKLVPAYEISIYNLPEYRNFLLQEAFSGLQEAFSGVPRATWLGGGPTVP
jgi:hypothetical protein